MPIKLGKSEPVDALFREAALEASNSRRSAAAGAAIGCPIDGAHLATGIAPVGGRLRSGFEVVYRDEVR